MLHQPLKDEKRSQIVIHGHTPLEVVERSQYHSDSFDSICSCNEAKLLLADGIQESQKHAAALLHSLAETMRPHCLDGSFDPITPNHVHRHIRITLRTLNETRQNKTALILHLFCHIWLQHHKGKGPYFAVPPIPENSLLYEFRRFRHTVEINLKERLDGSRMHLVNQHQICCMHT